MSDFAIVSTTIDSEVGAKALARHLVEERLAACVQIMPIDSVYRWQGAVEEAREWLLLCKIKSLSYERVEAAIRDRHTYDVPEIVMTSILRGHQDYLGWIEAGTTS